MFSPMPPTWFCPAPGRDRRGVWTASAEAPAEPIRHRRSHGNHAHRVPIAPLPNSHAGHALGVGKTIGWAAPSGLRYGDSARDLRRAMGGAGPVICRAEGPRPTADGCPYDDRWDRVAVPHRRAVAWHPGEWTVSVNSTDTRVLGHRVTLAGGTGWIERYESFPSASTSPSPPDHNRPLSRRSDVQGSTWPPMVRGGRSSSSNEPSPLLQHDRPLLPRGAYRRRGVQRDTMTCALEPVVPRFVRKVS